MTDMERIDAAIEAIEIEQKNGFDAYHGTGLSETILEALRFQKAAMGEPSEAMIEAAETCNPMDHYPKSLHGLPTKKERCSAKYKAMIAELAKQVRGNE